MVPVKHEHTQQASVGPSYADVAERYKGEKDVIKRLGRKIYNGGAGEWGEVPMPPHTQYKRQQLVDMVEAILSLESEGHKE